MATNQALKSTYYSKIVRSLKYLEYSYLRTLSMPVQPQAMTDSQLEAWDSFASRFARTSDIFLSKYVRACVLADDPAFDGGFYDQLNRAEKLGLIDSVTTWFEIRELRNATVHEYSDQDLEKIFLKFRQYAPLLIELRTKLAASASAE
ncbi:MAG: hypothetical protein AAGB31_03250 [Bdellovibrio sp.]